VKNVAFQHNHLLLYIVLLTYIYKKKKKKLYSTKPNAFAKGKVTFTNKDKWNIETTYQI